MPRVRVTRVFVNRQQLSKYNRQNDLRTRDYAPNLNVTRGNANLPRKCTSSHRPSGEQAVPIQRYCRLLMCLCTKLHTHVHFMQLSMLERVELKCNVPT